MCDRSEFQTRCAGGLPFFNTGTLCAWKHLSCKCQRYKHLHQNSRHWSKPGGNMDSKEQMIQYLTLKKKELTEKREKLMRPVQEVDQELAHLTGTISLLLREGNTSLSATEVTGFPLRKIKNMTKTQAIAQIAKYNGGTIKSLEIKPILIATELRKKNKNKAQTV